MAQRLLYYRLYYPHTTPSLINVFSTQRSLYYWLYCPFFYYNLYYTLYYNIY